MKPLWFKAKTYGWGWYPAAWQGWVVLLVYVVLVVLFVSTIDERSPLRELVFTCVLPVTLLTATLIRVCYATGEKPRWRWGKDT